MELLNETLTDRQLNGLVECDVSRLPSATHYRDLPDVPAVYFILVESVAVYVGISRRLRGRWSGGHVHAGLLDEPGARITYLILPNCDLLRLRVEAAFIRKLKPELNKMVRGMAESDYWHRVKARQEQG